MIDKILGHYRIGEKIGAGGMGDVYRARDQQLDRDVALKILPAAAFEDETARARLVREARAAAALNHPHICIIYEVGEAEGQAYIALEYIEGRSLSDLLAHQRLPLEQSLRYAVQIADAVAHAHERGIVHRDLKSANVVITADGRAKVLDFGLAKRSQALTEATTRFQTALSEAGALIGTLPYMSPEQLRGREADARSDIWAIGVMLYEMTTGSRPFHGQTGVELGSAILSEQLPPLPAQVPTALQAAIRRALAKDPGQRYQRVIELRAALEAIQTGIEPLGMRESYALARRRAPVLALGLLVLALGYLAWILLPSDTSSVMLADFRQVTRSPEPELEPMISPDGREVVYSAGYWPQTRLYVRDLTGGREIALTDNRPGPQEGPRWLPDGRSIIFVERGASYIVPRFGGPARELLDRGEVWSIHGNWLAYSRADRLFARETGTEDEQPIAAPLRTPHSAAWAPDGRRLAFVVGNRRFVRGPEIGNISRSAIWVAHRDGDAPHAVLDDGHMNTSPVWFPDGRTLLFISDRDGPRDLYILRLDSADRPRAKPVRLSTGLEPHSVSLSSDGKTAGYSRFILRKNIWRVTLPLRGSTSIREAERVVSGNEIAETHDVSRDGRWLAFDSDREGNHDIYIMPLAGGEARRLTTDSSNEFCPNFSPDGREMVFLSQRYGIGDLFLVRTDGTGERQLTNEPGLEWYPSFSPEGLHIAYTANGGAVAGVYAISREPGSELWSKPRLLAATSGVGGGSADPTTVDVARWSPNGREVAFVTEQRLETVTLEGRRRVVIDAHSAGLSDVFAPAWSSDGRTLYFRGTDASGQPAIYAVAAAGDTPRPVVKLGDPRLRVHEALTVSGNQLFVTLTEYEADVWTVQLRPTSSR